MAKYRVFNLGGKQLKVSPFLQNPGDMTRCVNMDTDYIGAKTKRSGYVQYFAAPTAGTVTNLFNWTKDDGTTFYNYTFVDAGGSSYLYYSAQGTGTPTMCGAGTFSGDHLGYTVLANTLYVGDGVGTLKFTSNGTSFATGTAAPIGEHLASYQNRVYVGGTASTLFYSAAGNGADWATTGTSDSSSLTIPGAGKINKVMVTNDRVVASKTSGLMYRWDGYSLRKLPTNKGLSSPYSVAETEDYFFFLNRDGIYGFNGDRPEIVSNADESEIYNKSLSGIAGSVFNDAPASMNRYNYLLSVGDVTDDVTKETISNDVIKYDYQLNQFSNYSLAEKPTALMSYKDESGILQFVFGGTTGVTYKLSGTATSDNGTPIESVMEGVLSFNDPESHKLYQDFWAFASPGCSAKVQVAPTDSFTSVNRKWIDIGEFRDGVAHLEFPSQTVGHLLAWRVYERSSEAPFTIYGFVVELEPLKV